MMNNTSTLPKLKFKNKIGYTIGDIGQCVMDLFRGAYLGVFFTLVVKINPAHLAILMLVTKIWDAINDPIIGALVDMRGSKNGSKFRWWMKTFAVPMALIGVLGFMNIASWNYVLKLVYFVLTYVLYEGCLTCVAVPYGSLSSAMTDDVNDRADLSRYRSLGGTIVMTVLIIVAPLILFDKERMPIPGNFTIMALIIATVALLGIFISYKWCPERLVLPTRPKEKLNYFKILKDIAKNKALIGLMAFSLIAIIGAGITNGLNVYLYRDYFGDMKSMALSGMISVLWTAIAFVLSKYVVKVFGKKEWIIIGSTCSILIYVFMLIFPPKSAMLFIILNGIAFIGTSGAIILIWALVNDAIDYQELKTGERKEGIVYSSYTFFRKLANAFSSSGTLFILGLIAYDVNSKVQTAEVAKNIFTAYALTYITFFTIGIILLALIYPLTKKRTAEMIEQLKEKRAAAASTDAEVKAE
ncbi:MAG: MFS transporter [Clostridia bacterium]